MDNLNFKIWSPPVSQKLECHILNNHFNYSTSFWGSNDCTFLQVSCSYLLTIVFKMIKWFDFLSLLQCFPKAELFSTFVDVFVQSWSTIVNIDKQWPWLIGDGTGNGNLERGICRLFWKVEGMLEKVHKAPQKILLRELRFHFPFLGYFC